MSKSNNVRTVAPTQPTTSTNSWSPMTRTEEPTATLWPITRTEPMADVESDILLKKLCLKEGQHKFTIQDNVGNGMCCSWGDGHTM